MSDSSIGVTSVPKIYLTDNGFQAPTEQQILSGVLSDINSALGGNTNTNIPTPQGQLATSETAIIGNCYDAFINLLNSIDPRNATGKIQDAIGEFYFIHRKQGENAASFENRRKKTLEKNSQSVNSAIMGAILDVHNVTDAYVVDNPLSVENVIGGVTIPPRTIYCVANGGDPNDIAQAILSKKTPAIPMFGNTHVTVKDNAAIYNGNGPSYTISFDYAKPIDIFFNVTLKNSSLVPSDAQNQIQNAIVNVFNGTAGSKRATIGSSIYASSYYSAVAALGSWVNIENIKVGTSPNDLNDVINPNINSIPNLTYNNIALGLI